MMNLPASRSRAFTLTEILVGATLGLMVLGIAYSYLVPTMRAVNRGSVRVEMQQQALIALIRMQEDFQATNVGGVSLRTAAPTVLALQPVLGRRDDGLQVWRRQVVIYHLDSTTRELFRFVYPRDPDHPEGPDPMLRHIRPKRLAPGILATLAGLPGPRRERLAVGVTALKVDHAGGTLGLAQPLTVTLCLEREAATGRREPEKLSVSRTMFLRSQR